MAYYSQANHKAKNYNTVSHSPICRVDYIKSSIRLQQQKIFGEHLFHFLRNLFVSSVGLPYTLKSQTLAVLQSVAKSLIQGSILTSIKGTRPKQHKSVGPG